MRGKNMNRQINVLSAFVLLTVLMGALIVACASTEPTSEPGAPGTTDAQALVKERCAVHHDLARVTQATKTSDEWGQTVKRMVSKGANLSDGEQAAVIEYLSEAYPK
jgi:quinohemoprotein amine dehydrogenase alpha subunit-like protein